jgi:hypothetical protein
LAVYILDQYLSEKANQGVCLRADNLYLLGISIVFLSSKYEDVVPIYIRKLVEDAGHNRFNRCQILDME